MTTTAGQIVNVKEKEPKFVERAAKNDSWRVDKTYVD